MLALAEKIVSDGNESCSVIASDNGLMASSATDFIAAFESLDCGGASCTIDLRHDYSETIDTSTYDFASDIETVMAAGSDAIFFNGYPEDGLGYLQAALAAGYSNTPYISVAMGNNIGEFLDATVADEVRWIYSPPFSGKSFDFFKSAYESTYNEDLDSSHIAEQAYDMVMILAIAIAKAGTDTDSAAISEAIFEISNPPGEKVYAGQYAEIVQMVTGGTDVDYVGASGDCDFDDRGDAQTISQIMGYSDDGSPVAKD
jgi:branched-chain amino acid transport system substrate-binding protein